MKILRFDHWIIFDDKTKVPLASQDIFGLKPMVRGIIDWVKESPWGKSTLRHRLICKDDFENSELFDSVCEENLCGLKNSPNQVIEYEYGSSISADQFELPKCPWYRGEFWQLIRIFLNYFKLVQPDTEATSVCS